MIRAFIETIRAIRFGVLALAGCLAFAACADTTNMTPAQQAIEQSKRRFITTTAEGVAAGAVLGALVGGLTGGGRGALIGAAAGGALGGVAGYAVAQNNFQRSHSESDLGAAINDANQQSSVAQQDASLASQIAAEARSKTAQLRAQYRSGQITAAQYRANMVSYNTSLKSLQDISKGQGDEIALLRQSASQTSGSNAQAFLSSASQIARSKAAVDRSIGDLVQATTAEPS